MQTHKHPLSGAEIAGIILGSGAVLTEDDCYSSSNGKWAKCPCPGLIIGPNAGAVWIRRKTLSAAGQQLLSFVASNEYFIVHTTHWKVIPSARWKYDGRMYWRVRHQDAAKELQNLGLIETTFGDSEIFQVSNEGRRYFENLCQ